LAHGEVNALFDLEMEPAAPASAPATARPRSEDTDLYTRLRAMLRKNGILTNARAQELTGKTAALLRPLLQRLVADGHARIKGQKRGTRYVAT